MASSPKQKNKRLSQHDRIVLGRFAEQQIKKTESTDELDAAYEKAADAIAAAVEEKYPAKEMRVLAKHNMASKDACVFVSAGGYGDFDRFEFREGDKRIALRPDRYCRRQPILLEDKRAEDYTAFKKARAAYDEAVSTRHDDFKALIGNSTTFNALADVWPAVEALRTEIVGSSASLSIMSDDVLKRIKADPALSAEQVPA